MTSPLAPLSSPELVSTIASVAASEGEARWFFGDLAVIKLSGTQTGGRMAIVEFTALGGSEPPRHTHSLDDEVFIVEEGEITFRVGERRVDAIAGHIVLAPKGIPHTYTVRSQRARWLVVTFPAGFEAFVREASAPAGALRLPRPDEPQGDPAAFVQIGRRHGIEFELA